MHRCRARFLALRAAAALVQAAWAARRARLGVGRLVRQAAAARVVGAAWRARVARRRCVRAQWISQSGMQGHPFMLGNRQMGGGRGVAGARGAAQVRAGAMGIPVMRCIAIR